MSMRHLAADHADEADRLLACGRPEDLRYACLNARMAIEFLVYDQLEGYLPEVADDAMAKWTPRDVLDELLAIDPEADETRTIEVGLSAETTSVLGTEYRMPARRASTLHSALGNFLHAPTINQMRQGRMPSPEKMEKKLREVLAEVRKVLASPIWRSGFANLLILKCECGRVIRRRENSVDPAVGIVCPNQTCGAVHDVTAVDKEAQIATFMMRKTTFPCASCKTTNYVPVHWPKHGRHLVCAKCDSSYRLELVLTLVPIPRTE